MFRRRRGGFGGRIQRPREPKMWDRFKCAVLDGSNIFAAPAGVTLWDPSAMVAGDQDLRLTLMRLMVDGHVAITLTGAANPSETNVAFGIYLAGSDEGLRDPTLPNASDRHADWLWLNHSAVGVTLASPILIGGNIGTRNIQNTTGLTDIRTKRKVDQDQLIKLSIRFRSAVGAVSAATVQAELYSSVLYQRTMR